MDNNCIPRPMCLDMSPMTSGFGISQMYGFVATKKDNRMEKKPNSIAINIGELL